MTVWRSWYWRDALQVWTCRFAPGPEDAFVPYLELPVRTGEEAAKGRLFASPWLEYNTDQASGLWADQIFYWICVEIHLKAAARADPSPADLSLCAFFIFHFFNGWSWRFPPDWTQFKDLKVVCFCLGVYSFQHRASDDGEQWDGAPALPEHPHPADHIQGK